MKEHVMANDKNFGKTNPRAPTGDEGDAKAGERTPAVKGGEVSKGTGGERPPHN
jgi:hypothetical protein